MTYLETLLSFDELKRVRLEGQYRQAMPCCKGDGTSRPRVDVLPFFSISRAQNDRSTNPIQIIFWLVILIGAALISGCGRNTASDTAVTRTAPEAPADAALNPNSNGPNRLPSVSKDPIEQVRELIAQNQLDQARQKLEELEVQELTPSQRRSVEALKAQLWQH